VFLTNVMNLDDTQVLILLHNTLAYYKSHAVQTIGIAVIPIICADSTELKAQKPKEVLKIAYRQIY